MGHLSAFFFFFQCRKLESLAESVVVFRVQLCLVAVGVQLPTHLAVLSWAVPKCHS